MANSKKNNIYHACSYLRISKEDGDKSESDSIANQRDLIKYFLSNKPEIHLISEHIDDGFSGVSFERPGFKQMINKIHSLEINCIIVKDLSRFGRNFIETGRYIDYLFPQYNIRFISINDNFDSSNVASPSDNILLPFLNLVNDAFCRDISIKIRSQLEIKRKNGEFIGAFAVYGYLKDPINTHKLIIDPFAANIIRDIFKWKLEGYSQQRIADRLNYMGVLSPSEYKKFCGLPYHSGFLRGSNGKWSAVAVGRILHNEFYIGTLVQGKRTTPNHKVKKTVYRPSHQWIRIEHCHDPIVTDEVFFTVQRLCLKDTRTSPTQETVSVFSGLIFCGDCGENMVQSSVSQNGKIYNYYVCCQNRTTKGCSSHRISQDKVSKAVTEFLKQHNYIHTLTRLVAVTSIDKILIFENCRIEIVLLPSTSI